MKFGLEPIDVKRRSKVYWEVYTLELIECFSHGRPSTFSLVPSDVAMPSFPDAKTNCAFCYTTFSSRAFISIFYPVHAFRYRLAAECLTPLSKQAFGLKVPMYTSVVELDRKIRKICDDFGIGASGQKTTFSGLDESEAMQNYIKLVYRESSKCGEVMTTINLADEPLKPYCICIVRSLQGQFRRIHPTHSILNMAFPYRELMTLL